VRRNCDVLSGIDRNFDIVDVRFYRDHGTQPQKNEFAHSLAPFPRQPPKITSSESVQTEYAAGGLRTQEQNHHVANPNSVAHKYDHTSRLGTVHEQLMFTDGVHLEEILLVDRLA
jgi:hypothetical protein